MGVPRAITARRKDWCVPSRRGVQTLRGLPQNFTDDGGRQESRKTEWTDAPTRAAMTPEGRPCSPVPSGNRRLVPSRCASGRHPLPARHGLEENARGTGPVGALYGAIAKPACRRIVLGIGGLRKSGPWRGPDSSTTSTGARARVLQRIRDCDRMDLEPRSTKCGGRPCHDEHAGGRGTTLFRPPRETHREARATLALTREVLRARHHAAARPMLHEARMRTAGR